MEGFPSSSGGEESTCDAGDWDSNPGSGRFPGEGKGSPLQHFCLENPMDRGEWQATVHEVARVGHDLVTKPLTTKFDDYSTILFSVFIILCFKCLQFIF